MGNLATAINKEINNSIYHINTSEISGFFPLLKIISSSSSTFKIYDLKKEEHACFLLLRTSMYLLTVS